MELLKQIITVQYDCNIMAYLIVYNNINYNNKSTDVENQNS